jgi:hypothetical protein
VVGSVGRQLNLKLRHEVSENNKNNIWRGGFYNIKRNPGIFCQKQGFWLKLSQKRGGI